jgi:hypothetical protein
MFDMALLAPRGSDERDELAGWMPGWLNTWVAVRKLRRLLHDLLLLLVVE